MGTFTVTELLQYSLTQAEPYTTEVSVVHVEAKRTSEAIHFLSSKYNLEDFGLSHLKRAKKSKCATHTIVIIAPTEEVETLEEIDFLAFPCEVCGTYSTALVSKTSPYTKNQLARWARLWPCNINQPSVPPYVHSEEELRMLDEVFRNAAAGVVIMFKAKDGSSVCGKQGEWDWQHPSIMAIEQVQVKDEEYLCSECVAVCFEEPCVMCAMALVHSRVKRVYFCVESTNGGFSCWKLQERNLNYMYKIFKVEKEFRED
jgi:tRNA(Arg) A34 adenosine deaminase TadA